MLRERLLREKIKRVACRPIWSKIQDHKTKGSTDLEVEREIMQDVQINSEGIFKLVNTVLSAFDDNARTSSSEIAPSHQHDDSDPSSHHKPPKKKEPTPRIRKQPSRNTGAMQKARSGKQFTEEQKLRIVNKVIIYVRLDWKKHVEITFGESVQHRLLDVEEMGTRIFRRERDGNGAHEADDEEAQTHTESCRSHVGYQGRTRMILFVNSDI
jgi:hypothetical protein